VIRRRHRPEHGLGGAGLLLPGGLVGGRRGVDHDHQIAGKIVDGGPVDVGHVARHHVVGAVRAGREARHPEGPALGAQRALELEVGARGVAAPPHGDHPPVVLDHGVGERGERHAHAGVAEVDGERELADGGGVGRRSAQRVDVLEAPGPRAHELQVAQHHAPRSRGRHGEDPGAVAVPVDPLEQRRLVRGAHRGLVLGGGLLPLDDLALDELAVGLDGERGDHRALGTVNQYHPSSSRPPGFPKV